MLRAWSIVLALLAVLFLAAPALAEGGANPLLPPRLDLTIWTIVVFVIMLVVLRLLAWKPILLALQGREKAIADAIEQAKKDREEAARLREQYQRELNQGAEQVRAMLDEGRRDVQHQRDEMLAAARAEIQEGKDRARREIDMARAFIEQWSDDSFDFGKYEDTHRSKVEKLIAAQTKRKTVKVVEEKGEETAPVMNLMEALKKSMQSRSKGRVRRGRSHAA